MRDRLLAVSLFFLVLLTAAPARAGQSSPGASLPGDPFAGDGFQTPAAEGEIQGDPFEAGGDPFADDPAFQAFSDEKAAKGDSDDAAEGEPAVSLHGYLESRSQLRTKDGDAISARQRFWLEADGILSPGDSYKDGFPLRFFASGAIDVDPPADDLSDDHNLVRFHAHEVYATIDTDGADFVLGRKMLRWGTGDGVNPMDLINPLDYRYPVASGRADSRIPVILGQAVVPLPTFGALQEAVFEGVAVPQARVNQLNAPGSAWESRGLKELREADAQGLLVLDEQERPDRFFRDMEFGTRLAATFSGWDLALIGFYGYVDSPVFERKHLPDESGKEITHYTPVHPDFTTLGFNFAKGLDRSTLRGELAIKPDKPMMLSDPDAVPGYDRRTVLEGVIGVDRTFGTNLYTNIQYFGTFIDDADDLTADRCTHGITYDIHDLFLLDDLEAGVRGMASFSGQGWTCEPYAEYNIGDDWLLAVSLMLFEGDETGSYGQYGDNDSVIVRVRYSF